MGGTLPAWILESRLSDPLEDLVDLSVLGFTPEEVAELAADDNTGVSIGADWNSTLTELFRIGGEKLAASTSQSKALQVAMKKLVAGVVRWCKMRRTSPADVDLDLRLHEDGRFVLSIYRR